MVELNKWVFAILSSFAGLGGLALMFAWLTITGKFVFGG